MWLTDYSANGFSGRIGITLEKKWLIYLGKISYGIYVYHYFIAPLVLEKILSYLNVSLSSIWILFILKTFMALTIAALFWHILEEPIGKLKRYSVYRINTQKGLSVWLIQ